MRKINWESLSKAFYTEVSFFHLIQIYSISHSTSQKKGGLKKCLLPSGEETYMQSSNRTEHHM